MGIGQQIMFIIIFLINTYQFNHISQMSGIMVQVCVDIQMSGIIFKYVTYLNIIPIMVCIQ